MGIGGKIDEIWGPGGDAFSQAKLGLAETYREFRTSPDFPYLTAVLSETLSYAMAGC